MNELYNMIFKRKSFHLFNSKLKISEKEINAIYERYNNLIPLYDDIKTSIKIVPSKQSTCRRGNEYTILIYSEKEDNYLTNIGYMFEQLDIYLASINIGALWYGIGKESNLDNLDFVIMMGISKVNENDFRKDMYKSKRKNIEEIFEGEYYKDIFDIARFSPSACNTQPWKVKTTKNEINISRYKLPGKRGIMPVDKVMYYNKIDIGIFLLISEVIMKHNNISYDRKLFVDNSSINEENTLIATYRIKNE